ncbi:unnamed protein product [Orchesella dallaii]|uniref:Uncharacterized protein n=1 Tax=Orchesella dallaii TaxID=48710 RepID=A0ABP1Q3A9_9HEXA
MEGNVFFCLLLCFLLNTSESKLSTERVEKVNITIEAATAALEINSGSLYPFLLEIEDLVGNHIDNEITRKSLFFLYRHFNHINIPGNSDWLEGYEYNLMIDNNFRHIRRVHDRIQDVRELIEDCKAARDEAIGTELTLPTNETINWCIEKGNESLAYITSPQYELDVKLARLDALNIVIYTFIRSFVYWTHNGEPMPSKNTTRQLFLAPFWKMWHDIELMDGRIYELIRELIFRYINNEPPGREYYNYALESVLTNKLDTPEYTFLYSENNHDGVAERRPTLERLEQQILSEFETGSPTKLDWEGSYKLWRGDYSKFSEAEYTEFKKKATDLYAKNFRVELLNPNDPPHLYRWKQNNENSVLFNMTLAWDKMDEVYEQILCYAGISYLKWRNESLQQAQKDITEGILFNGISYTLGQPCVTDFYPIYAQGFAYYDLVGDYCTSENNEICAPRPLSQFEDPDNQMKGGMSVLKPKWVFSDAKDRTPDGKCFGYKTWVIQQQACRCGFRTDCGNDLEVSINCPLQPNDWEVRRQCRGSVGYPCKSLPMAPGKHHESCVTGYCDMMGNSCEDGPIYEQYSGAVLSPFRILTFTQIISSIFFLVIGILS